MDKQALFGAFHISCLVIGLAAAVGLAFLLRNTNERQNRRVLLVIGIALALSEAYKQLFWFYAVGYDEYPFIIFPFHLCSMPMYVCLLFGLLRDGKAKGTRQLLYDFLASFCFIGGLISVTVDGGLLRPYWVLAIHGMAWHFVLVFLGLYLGFSRRVGRRKGGFIRATALYLGLCVAAFCVNLAFWELSKGTIDMFFVGPAKMNVVVYRDIGAALGRPFVTAVYLATITLASGAAYKLLSRRKGRGRATGNR
jgi:uncharacterized membrane protein YwaF